MIQRNWLSLRIQVNRNERPSFLREKHVWRGLIFVYVDTVQKSQKNKLLKNFTLVVCNDEYAFLQVINSA